MDEKWKQLKKWIDESDNIVFLAVRGYLRKAAFLISAVKMVFFRRSMNMACARK